MSTCEIKKTWKIRFLASEDFILKSKIAKKESM